MPAVLPLVLPLAILALPFLDLTMAFVRRTYAGRWWFLPDKQHLHHRLLERGHSQRRAVLLMYVWSALVSFGVIVLGTGPHRPAVAGGRRGAAVRGGAAAGHPGPAGPPAADPRSPPPALTGVTAHSSLISAGAVSRRPVRCGCAGALGVGTNTSALPRSPRARCARRRRTTRDDDPRPRPGARDRSREGLLRPMTVDSRPETAASSADGPSIHVGPGPQAAGRWARRRSRRRALLAWSLFTIARRDAADSPRPRWPRRMVLFFYGVGQLVMVLFADAGARTLLAVSMASYTGRVVRPRARAAGLQQAHRGVADAGPMAIFVTTIAVVVGLARGRDLRVLPAADRGLRHRVRAPVEREIRAVTLTRSLLACGPP